MSRSEVYFEFIKIKMKSMIEYRGAFLLTSLSKGSVWITEILLLYILINQFKTISGWNAQEVMLLYSLNLLTYSLAAFFLFHPCISLPARIHRGEFDEILTKPLNPFLYLVCREFSTGYFSNVTVALGAMIFSLAKLNINFNAQNCVFLLLVVFGGTLIQAAAFILTSVPAFWMIQNNSLMSLILFDIKGFIRYPITVYHKFVQIFLTFIIPFAFINFYPAHFFLKKRDMLFPIQFQYLTPAIGVSLFSISLFFWHKGIRAYKSTGS